jgi:cytochrome o ubiquinol oxidase operon protein cyoD
MSNKEHMNHQSEHHSSVTPYVIGFLFSLILTLGSYLLVVHRVFETGLLVAGVILLALLQLLVQLFYFLHLGQEAKPRWKLAFFLSTVAIILIVVLGSLWIMHHLNYNMMPGYMDNMIIQDEGIKPKY